LSTFAASARVYGALVLRAFPPLAWTALIAWLSSESWSAAQTASSLVPLLERLLPWAAPEQIDALHGLTRKAAHVAEYAVLASLWRWTLGRSTAIRGLWIPLGLSAATASLDELHQATTASRGASPADVLLDAAAAACLLGALTVGVRHTVERLTGVLLWIAAAGGTALLLLNWVAGAPFGWLTWSVPTAWIALGVRLATRRRG
jgi:VanZ family protein